MHMKNKNIYRDTVRWMLLPVLSNVIYEVLKLSMVFIVAYFLGRVTDAAIAGKYDVFLDKGKVLLLIIAIGAVCVPLAAIAMDFIWIKAGSVSDIEMCSKISFWKYDKLRKMDEGEIEYKLSEELCEFRICFANVLSTLILVPIFGIFLAYCVKQMGVVYLLFGICCSLFTLLIPIIFRKINLKYEKENWNYLSGQNQIFTQISQFAKTIKCFGLKNGIVKKWKLRFEKYLNSSRKKAIKIENLAGEANGFVKAVSQIAVLILGCILMEKKMITTGCIVIMLQYLSIFDTFFDRCIQSITNISKVREKANRLHIFYDNLERENGVNLWDRVETICCKNLSYSYDGNSVIDNLSFSIKKGEKIQIKGQNGSGKSTLLKILCGLETEYEGDVLINNIEIRRINLSMWRKKLAVIFQNAYIFSGTVAENVAMGKLNAAEEQMQKQMWFVKIDDMAQKAISYGANELSGGEKQRIAVARAALKDSEIILMDEGDNHLDAEGKKILFNYLKQTDQTVIFISHDLEFGKVADRVLNL